MPYNHAKPYQHLVHHGNVPDYTTMNQLDRPGLPEMPSGEIIVAPRAIASIAARTARRVDGIAGLARVDSDHAAQIAPDEESAGLVQVHIQHTQLHLDVPVVLVYDAPMAEVSARAEQAIRSALEQALGRTPDRVTIRVVGVV
jgi:uncharacterized alkaline shock family protein YloU